MFNFLRRTTRPALVPSQCLDVETAAVIKTKQSNHHTFSVLDSGELVIDHKVGTDKIQLTAMEARSLRNLLNKSDVRSTIGTPVRQDHKKAPALDTYTDNFAYFKGLEPDDISA